MAGLGNPLMQDEGVGVRVLNALWNEAERFPRVEFEDLGAGGLSLLHAARRYDTLIVIDCARMGEEPGTLRRFEPDEVSTTKEMSGRSVHEADILQVLELARLTEDAPRQVVVFGIEPETVAFGEGLSPALQEKLDEYVAAVKDELPAGPEPPSSG